MANDIVKMVARGGMDSLRPRFYSYVLMGDSTQSLDEGKTDE